VPLTDDLKVLSRRIGVIGISPARIGGTIRRKGAAMRAAYRAVLHGNHLEWRDEEPKGLSPDRTVEVSVTILEPTDSPATAQARGAAMAAALERLATAGGPRSFGDAAGWERDTREERTLPGRES
jgi:hypothetical protein